MKLWAIIPAGGSGSRFGSKKQFELLAGRPILLHTLEKFANLPFSSLVSLEGIVLPVPKSDIPRTKNLVQAVQLPVRVIAGGHERQDSVKKGFDQVPPCDMVLIHDAVRPLVDAETIKKVLETAARGGACIAGRPVQETIKRVGEDRVVLETVDRRPLWLIQTPQAFHTSILQRAFEAAEKDRFLGTDEAMLVERIGVPVRVIEGNRLNIKITTPEDLALAESLRCG